MRGISLITLLLCGFSCSLASGQASFQGLGDLPDGSFSSVAFDVSADGSVVVGESNSAFGTEAVRWESGVMIGLGDLPGGGFFSTARGVSLGGSVVVGYSRSAAALGLFEAFRWEAGVMTGLGDLPGGDFFSEGSDVSADGMVVVGASTSAPVGGRQAFRWTEATGMVGLGFLPGGTRGSAANTCSADGSVVVGWGHYTGSSFIQPWRWSAETGMVGLGGLFDRGGGQVEGNAIGVSADGSVVVGSSNYASGLAEAFRWTAETGMVGLGDLPGGAFFSQALGVSADGSVVIGHGTTAAGREAFIWDSSNGMRNLKDVLVNDFGLNLTGWTLREPRGPSDDGQVIAGSGTNPNGQEEGWIAELNEPPDGIDEPPGGLVAQLDIKPGSCPNPVNPSSGGFIPISLLGTEGFDVMTVHLGSILLSRADGVGGNVFSHEGPPGPHSVFEDTGTPFDGDLCDCHELEGDGILDLSMNFKRQSIVEELELNDLPPGSVVELIVSGALLDGTEFTAADCIIIAGN